MRKKITVQIWISNFLRLEYLEIGIFSSSLTRVLSTGGPERFQGNLCVLGSSLQLGTCGTPFGNVDFLQESSLFFLPLALTLKI